MGFFLLFDYLPVFKFSDLWDTSLELGWRILSPFVMLSVFKLSDLRDLSHELGVGEFFSLFFKRPSIDGILRYSTRNASIRRH